MRPRAGCVWSLARWCSSAKGAGRSRSETISDKAVEGEAERDAALGRCEPLGPGGAWRGRLGCGQTGGMAGAGTPPASTPLRPFSRTTTSIRWLCPPPPCSPRAWAPQALWTPGRPYLPKCLHVLVHALDMSSSASSSRYSRHVFPPFMPKRSQLPCPSHHCSGLSSRISLAAPLSLRP